MLLLHDTFNFYNFISLPIAGRFLLIVSLSIFFLCHYLFVVAFSCLSFFQGILANRHCLRRGPLAAAWLGYTKDLLVPGSSEARGVTWGHGILDPKASGC